MGLFMTAAPEDRGDDVAVCAVLGFLRQPAKANHESRRFVFLNILKIIIASPAVLRADGRGKSFAGEDILVIEKDSFELREVISGGRRLFKNGSIAFMEAFLKDGNRSIRLEGERD